MKSIEINTTEEETIIPTQYGPVAPPMPYTYEDDIATYESDAAWDKHNAQLGHTALVRELYAEKTDNSLIDNKSPLPSNTAHIVAPNAPQTATKATTHMEFVEANRSESGFQDRKRAFTTTTTPSGAGYDLTPTTTPNPLKSDMPDTSPQLPPQ